jgi:hypothetical protein
MRKIRLEAEPLNNPATFAKFSKMQRELNKLSAREQAILNSEPPPPTTSETILKWMPTVTKVCCKLFTTSGSFVIVLDFSSSFPLVSLSQVLAYAALAFFFWSTPLFAMPDGSWLLSKLQVIAPPAAASVWPVDSVGVLPWLFVARQLAAIGVNKLFPPPPPPKFSFM